MKVLNLIRLTLGKTGLAAIVLIFCLVSFQSLALAQLQCIAGCLATFTTCINDGVKPQTVCEDEYQSCVDGCLGEIH